MSSVELIDIESITYRLRNETVRTYPFDHVYCNHFFEDSLYSEILENLPSESEMRPIEEVRPVKGYKERFVLQVGDNLGKNIPPEKADFWRNFASELREGLFAKTLLDLFGQKVNKRFAGRNKIELYDEILLVNDRTNYSLGPHTDSPRKVVTVLFYLPKNDKNQELGTSLYRPKTPGFECPGGPHHQFQDFHRVQTVKYAPNSMFAFAKSSNSFHGVEPVKMGQPNRWLMLYDIYERQV